MSFSTGRTITLLAVSPVSLHPRATSADPMPFLSTVQSERAKIFIFLMIVLVDQIKVLLKYILIKLSNNSYFGLFSEPYLITSRCYVTVIESNKPIPEYIIQIHESVLALLLFVQIQSMRQKFRKIINKNSFEFLQITPFEQQDVK